MKICAVVPSHNHWQALDGVIQSLRELDLPIFIIDDGSDLPAAAAIAAMHAPSMGVIVHRLEVNQGKGGAVMAGLRLAWEAGFTHALQIDADGQHDQASLPSLLAKAYAHPDALISGLPVYDASIPRARKIGRWITHAWVWIETWSLSIKDSMCGFRVYPLAAVRRVLSEHAVGRRMDFDIEIMVRLFWAGAPVISVPVRVMYPDGNISNFRMLGDNLRISAMHTRLVFAMLWCALRPWTWRQSQTRHWSSLGELGAYFGLRICVIAYRLLGRRGCMVVIAPVTFFFYLTSGEQRRASQIFLSRALEREANWRDGLRHFMSFASRTLDSFVAWAGAIPSDAVRAADPQALEAFSTDPRGALLVVAHIGNMELARALLDPKSRQRLTVLVHTRHAVNYNRIIREIRPDAAVNLIQVTEIGPETAIALKERIERGEWVVIAGDRTPVLSQGRVSRAPFLGYDAPFSHGPWVLAALLGCPVHLMACMKDGDAWRLKIEPFADQIVLPRKAREDALQRIVHLYAAKLEVEVKRSPLQWYNFFDFWAG